jgi:hypothetical protein
VIGYWLVACPEHLDKLDAGKLKFSTSFKPGARRMGLP